MPLRSSASRTADEENERGGWSPPLLAEAARADGAPSMRAVGGDPTALTRNGLESKLKKALAVGKGRVLARPGWAGVKERAVEVRPGRRSTGKEPPLQFKKNRKATGRFQACRL